MRAFRECYRSAADDQGRPGFGAHFDEHAHWSTSATAATRSAIDGLPAVASTHTDCQAGHVMKAMTISEAFRTTGNSRREIKQAFFSTYSF